MMNRIETIRIWKLGSVPVLWVLLAGNPPASPVMDGNSTAGDPSGAGIGDQEPAGGAGTRKPGKLIVVYTGDLQGNMGPCG